METQKNIEQIDPEFQRKHINWLKRESLGISLAPEYIQKLSQNELEKKFSKDKEILSGLGLLTLENRRSQMKYQLEYFARSQQLKALFAEFDVENIKNILNETKKISYGTYDYLFDVEEALEKIQSTGLPYQGETIGNEEKITDFSRSFSDLIADTYENLSSEKYPFLHNFAQKLEKEINKKYDHVFQNWSYDELSEQVKYPEMWMLKIVPLIDRLQGQELAQCIFNVINEISGYQQKFNKNNEDQKKEYYSEIQYLPEEELALSVSSLLQIENKRSIRSTPLTEEELRKEQILILGCISNLVNPLAKIAKSAANMLKDKNNEKEATQNILQTEEKVKQMLEACDTLKLALLGNEPQKESKKDKLFKKLKDAAREICPKNAKESKNMYKEATAILDKLMDEKGTLSIYLSQKQAMVPWLQTQINKTMISAQKTFQEQLPKMEDAIKKMGEAIKSLKSKEHLLQIDVLQQELSKMQTEYEKYNDKLKQINNHIEAKNEEKAKNELIARAKDMHKNMQNFQNENKEALLKLGIPLGEDSVATEAEFEANLLTLESCSLKELYQMQTKAQSVKDSIRGFISSDYRKIKSQGNDPNIFKEVQQDCKWAEMASRYCEKLLEDIPSQTKEKNDIMSHQLRDLTDPKELTKRLDATGISSVIEEYNIIKSKPSQYDESWKRWMGALEAIKNINDGKGDEIDLNQFQEHFESLKSLRESVYGKHILSSRLTKFFDHLGENLEIHYNEEVQKEYVSGLSRKESVRELASVFERPLPEFLQIESQLGQYKRNLLKLTDNERNSFLTGLDQALEGYQQLLSKYQQETEASILKINKILCVIPDSNLGQTSTSFFGALQECLEKVQKLRNTIEKTKDSSPLIDLQNALNQQSNEFVKSIKLCHRRRASTFKKVMHRL